MKKIVIFGADVHDNSIAFFLTARQNILVAINQGCGRVTAILIAGWSSLVARQAHNLKVVGSNPTPATLLNQFETHFGLVNKG